jgi:small-conductance mechanosensitive channel
MIHDISELMVFEFLIAGIFVFVGIRIVKKGLDMALGRRQVDPLIARFFPLAEFSVWIVFILWGAKKIFQTGITGSIVLLVFVAGILAWTGSFVIRDWIAGVVFRAEDSYHPGDSVGFGETRGRLTHLGYRSLTLERVDGNAVEIPYSALVREHAIEKFSREKAGTTFRLTVPDREPFRTVQQKIQTVVLCAPWSSILHKPGIRLADHRDHHYTVEVTAYLVDLSYAKDVEVYVKRCLDGIHSPQSEGAGSAHWV